VSVTSSDPAAALVALGASWFARGLAHGRTGNLSIRVGDDIVVTPTGASLGTLRADHLSRIDTGGRHVGGPKPSKEAFLHAAVYRVRPHDRAVVHLHCVHSVALSCLEDVDRTDALPPLTAYYVMRVGRLPILPYFDPGDDALTAEIEAMAAGHHAFLLANHGPVVSGPELAAAADAMEELEQTARLYFLLGSSSVRPVQADAIERLRRDGTRSQTVTGSEASQLGHNLDRTPRIQVFYDNRN
jgi:3-dehydro-4-phosphotetronate decarboxylase